MQQLYRINHYACFKPWRYNSVYFITNKEFFDKLKPYDGGEMETNIDLGELSEEDQERLDDVGIWEFIGSEDIEHPHVEYPIIILDEITIWTD